MKLLIQLVREILHLSGKSQGISNTYGCGNHAMATHSFPVPTHLISIYVIFSWKNVEQGHKLKLTYLYTCWIMYMRHLCKYVNVRQRWPEMPLILGRSGTQYVAMITKLLSSNCGAHLVESYCKESNISDTKWLRYLFSSYLIKIWLSV